METYPAATNMTSKAYVTGSTYPPLTAGTLRLYSMRLCPFAQRVRLVLAHKQIGYETININLKEKPEWFLERNPKGAVPVLEKDGKIIYESVIVCEYLDDIYPHDRLTPPDPYRKARDAILLDYYGNKYIPNHYKLLRDQKDEEIKDTFKKALQKLDDELKTRGKFFGGSQVAMIDFMIWPWIERLPVVAAAFREGTLSESNFPHLYAWRESMMSLSAVKDTAFDHKTHQQFYKKMQEGSADAYDIGLEE